MTGFDLAVVSVIGLSMLLGVMRGVVREALALIGWIAAFFAARWLAGDVAALLPDTIPNQGLRQLAAFIIVVIGVLLLMAFITSAATSLMRRSGLSTLDRSLGLLFGFTRGVVIMLLFVLVAGLTNLPRQVFWKNALLSAPFEAWARGLAGFLPEAFTKRIRY